MAIGSVGGESAAEPGVPHDRLESTPVRTAGPGVLCQEAGGGQDGAVGAALPKTATGRCRLSPPANRQTCRARSSDKNCCLTREAQNIGYIPTGQIIALQQRVSLRRGRGGHFSPFATRSHVGNGATVRRRPLPLHRRDVPVGRRRALPSLTLSSHDRDVPAATCSSFGYTPFIASDTFRGPDRTAACRTDRWAFGRVARRRARGGSGW